MIWWFVENVEVMNNFFVDGEITSSQAQLANVSLNSINTIQLRLILLYIKSSIKSKTENYQKKQMLLKITQSISISVWDCYGKKCLV